MKFTTAYHP